MFDDLDPDFLSSPGPALPIVAARVYAIRKRRWIVVSSAVGAIAVFILGSMAFGGGGKNPDRLTVSRRVTTTTEASSGILKPLVTAPTSSTSTTVAATSTTATVPIATTTTSPKTTTTAPTPAHLTVAFDRARLVIQSGKSTKISYTVTNDGGRPGRFGYASTRCEPDQEVWPEAQRVNPVAWPQPLGHRVICQPLVIVGVRPHHSVTLPVTIVAGLHDSSNNLVPAPPGETSYLVQNGTSGGGKAQLPVTITPPATPPLTISHPSEVTTGSNVQNAVDFTITNNLPFAVAFVEQGPCAHGGEAACASTFPHSARDLRRAPYDKADVPLWTTRFVLGAHETRMATASVDGVIDLGDDGSSSAPLPARADPYYFDWDGQKVKFTVTP
jgi:hypothetical protein